MLKNKPGVPKRIKYILIIILIVGVITELVNVITNVLPKSSISRNDETTLFKKYQLVDKYYAEFPASPTIETKESENILLTIGSCNYGLLTYQVTIARIKKLKYIFEDKYEELLENSLAQISKENKDAKIDKIITSEETGKVMYASFSNSMSNSELKMYIIDNAIISKVVSGKEINPTVKKNFFNN